MLEVSYLFVFLVLNCSHSNLNNNQGRQKKWIITTLGSQGSLMMRQKRQNNGNGQQESHPIVNYAALQSHIASSDPEELKIQYYSYEQTELLFCPTIQLSNSQIRDTTGAGKYMQIIFSLQC